VFNDAELDVIAVNDYRILVDRAGLRARMAALAERTAARAAGADPDGSLRYHRFLKELVRGQQPPLRPTPLARLVSPANVIAPRNSSETRSPVGPSSR
jgi:hypothetical protein